MIHELGKERLLDVLKDMLLIRNFEVRAEAAYQRGLIGGFFHSYIGQEAIQTAVLQAFGKDHWYITTYRCHAMALLLGATPKEIMAELFGRATGNALGRGGSMHLYTERLLGGFAIVGGQLPVAAGAAFTSRYLNKKEAAICFLGDGAVPQGAFHEALNLASLWDLPCVFVIENNQWGMGTHFQRVNSVDRLAEDKAPGYGMNSYTLDGMDFFSCYAGFEAAKKEVLETNRPVLIETVGDRFRGHSISDPGLYRTKEHLKERQERDPLVLFQNQLIEEGMVDENLIKDWDKKYREAVVQAIAFAEESPWPDPSELEKGVFAP